MTQRKKVEVFLKIAVQKCLTKRQRYLILWTMVKFNIICFWVAYKRQFNNGVMKQYKIECKYKFSNVVVTFIKAQSKVVCIDEMAVFN